MPATRRRKKQGRSSRSSRRRQVRLSRRRHRRGQRHGGKAIGSGGFACVFSPALPCEPVENHARATSHNTTATLTQKKKSPRERTPGYVSKLMLRKHAASEFRTIRDIRQRVQAIPRAAEFFLLEGAHLCMPSKLTQEDLSGFGKKCKSLVKRGFTAQNVNEKEKLDQLGAINEPFGGIDVYDYMRTVVQSQRGALDLLVTALLQLLMDGVGPMNRLGVFHCDIKDSNLLVQTTETRLFVRLIDWGLSVVMPGENAASGTGTGAAGTTKHSVMETWNTLPPTRVPYNLYYRPFEYNVPFSVVIFNNSFAKEYNLFCDKLTTATPSDFELYEFVLNYVFAWNKKRGAGHFSTIHSVFTKLSMDNLPDVQRQRIKQHVVEYDFTYHYVVEYIVAVLKKYGRRRDGGDRLGEYLYDVFLPNIDMWGMLMVFMNLYESMLVSPIAGINTDELKSVLVSLLFGDPTRVLTPELVARQLHDVFAGNANANADVDADEEG